MLRVVQWATGPVGQHALSAMIARPDFDVVTTAVVGGRRALTVEHITRMGPDEAPDWPRGRGWKVTIDGAPSMVLEAKIAVNGEDENDQGCLGTAMHAVHAIAPVCAAPPGIRTFLDLPTIMGRGVLERVR